MTKHEVMVSYVQDKIKELCDSILTFNFADGKATSVSFLTNYAGKIVKSMSVLQIKNMALPYF